MKSLCRFTTFLLFGLYAAIVNAAGNQSPVSKSTVSVRTEEFPRPPYSGATYYLYEKDGQVICTKLEVCNKFDECESQYVKGAYKDQEDVQTGAPYSKTDAVAIAPGKLNKHRCLTKYSLN
jgi:hypothetical protein